MAHPLIFNIQKFSIHDGSGIRTTVFFKGCPLRCAWCHNPESQAFTAEQVHYPERCIHCGRCDAGCPANVRETVGKDYSVEALCSLLERDQIFFDNSGGGVTLSGGEPMVQDEAFLGMVLERLARRGIPVAIDTSGYAPYQRFQAVMPYVDTFLYDIKMIDPILHERYAGVSNSLILDNARRLSNDGARIHIRVPVIPDINVSGTEREASTAGLGWAEMDRIIRFVRENICAEQVSLMPYHQLGTDKGARLRGWKGIRFEEPSPVVMGAVLSAWQEKGFTNVQIGG